MFWNCIIFSKQTSCRCKILIPEYSFLQKSHIFFKYVFIINDMCGLRLFHLIVIIRKQTIWVLTIIKKAYSYTGTNRIRNMVALRVLFCGWGLLILYILWGLSLQTHPSLRRKATTADNDRKKSERSILNNRSRSTGSFFVPHATTN